MTDDGGFVTIEKRGVPQELNPDNEIYQQEDESYYQDYRNIFKITLWGKINP